MLRNYLLIAVRNLRRHLGYTFVNVLGLAIGIACCLLVFLYIRFEYSFDAHHEKGDRAYRLIAYSGFRRCERRGPILWTACGENEASTATVRSLVPAAHRFSRYLVAS